MSLLRDAEDLALTAANGQEMTQNYSVDVPVFDEIKAVKLSPVDTCITPSRYVAVILCTKVNYENILLKFN